MNNLNKKLSLASFFATTLLISPAFAMKRGYDGSGEDGPKQKQISTEQVDILSQMPDEILVNHILPQFILENLKNKEDASLIESASLINILIKNSPKTNDTTLYVDAINAVKKLFKLKEINKKLRDLLTHKEIAKILKEAGIDINAPLKSAPEIPVNSIYIRSRQARSPGGTLLHVAIDAKDIDFFWFLVFAGANLNALDRYGCTPIKYCDDLQFLDEIITTSKSILVKLNLINLTQKTPPEDLIEADALFTKNFRSCKNG